MVDKGLVQSFLLQLEEKVTQLSKAPVKSLTDLEKDPILQNGILHLLQTAIEICLDTTNHMIADEGWRAPTSNKDVFQVLFEQNVLAQDLTKRCQNMAGFRNILVPMYEKIDLEDVYGILKNHLDDFQSFAHAIKKFMDGK